jgi:kelch-like protein 18
MAEARYEAACGVINGKLYVVGGVTANSRALNSFEIFDPETNTWTTGPPMPTARLHAGAAVIGNRLYVVGGMPGVPGGTPLRYGTLEIFDPVENIWTTGPPMPSARDVHAAAVMSNRLYAIGGYKDDRYLNVVEVFNPETNAWTTGPPLPTARFGLGATVVGGILYTLGGGCGFEDLSCLQLMEVFDPATGTWATGPSLPTGRTDAAVTTCGGKIFVIGGYGVPGCMGTVEIFDPGTRQCGGDGESRR